MYILYMDKHSVYNIYTHSKVFYQLVCDSYERVLWHTNFIMKLSKLLMIK